VKPQRFPFFNGICPRRLGAEGDYLSGGSVEEGRGGVEKLL
jgi:hypothetical protein